MTAIGEASALVSGVGAASLGDDPGITAPSCGLRRWMFLKVLQRKDGSLSALNDAQRHTLCAARPLSN
jgi:hypothetical protein